LGKVLLRTARIGTLATLEPAGGFPFATLVNVATDLDGTPLILVSQLSSHTRNLVSDARVSLLITKSGQNARAEKGDPMAHPRLTVQARAARIENEEVRARARRRFLARHPKAQIYADFADFAFFRLEPVSIHINGGFARAFEGDARYIMSDLPEPAAFDALEQDALDHLNADHAAALSLYAERLAGKSPGAWRAASLDPDGLDLMLGDEVLRLPFDHPARDAETLMAALKRFRTQSAQP